MDLKLLKDLFEEELHHWWHLGKRKLVMDFLPKSKKRVLILGVGGGWLAYQLRKEGFSVEGIDKSPEVCLHAHAHYAFEVKRHDLEKGLPFKDNSFDAVIITDVLEHIQNDGLLVAEMHRCLSKGGRLILTVPSYKHMWSYWDERWGHFRRYNHKNLKALIGGRGFHFIKLSYFNAVVYPAALVVRKCLGMGKSGSVDSKISQGGPIIQGGMGLYYHLERFCIKRGALPFGLSLFVCAEK